MKIGIISDIHGNYEALQTVLNQLDEHKVDDIYCLGDVGGYYSQINECCNELRRRKITSIMGNHDWYLSGAGFCGRSESVNELLDYQRTQITPENLAWLEQSPIKRSVGDFRMVHAGWTDPIDEYLRDPAPEYFNRLEGKYFLSGHTHVPIVLKMKEKTYCNPGSVGQPRDGDPRASFAIFENGEFKIYRVVYDIEKVCDLMNATGFSERYYSRIRQGK